MKTRMKIRRTFMSGVRMFATTVLATALAATALLAATAFAATATQVEQFDDVSSNHPNFKAIYYLESEGIVDGYDDGTFKPGTAINRAEFLKIVMGASEHEVEAEDEGCFKDIITGAWYAPYVCKAKDEGLIDGYKDGTFKPEQEINFAEASKMVVNILGLSTNSSNDDNWYHGFVSALEGLKSIPATVETFDKTVTRSEMADMMWRIDTENVFQISNTYEGLTEGGQVVAELISFDSCDEIKAYMEGVREDYYFDYDDVWFEEDVMLSPMSESDATMKASDSADMGLGGAEGGAEGADEYSSTNIQVEGVDEADIVKNDNQYVYLVKDYTVRIVDAYPPSEMTEVARVEFANEDFYPYEMYVDGDQLIVIGQSYEYLNYFVEEVEDALYGDEYTEMTEVYIFDISDRSDPVLERQLAFEGYYSTSRKVDDMLYLVANKYVYYGRWDDWDDSDTDGVVPLYADSAEDEVLVTCACADVRYEPSVESTDYLVVAGIPLDDYSAEVETEVVLGWSGTVYASRDNLYVAEPYYSPVLWDWDNEFGGWGDDQTIVHKFRLGRGNMAYLGSGVVEGRTLNQFSMDENDGYFRIATTQGYTWDQSDPSTNNLYVLDGDLTVVGSVEGLAPGEEIYSARFIGDRAYMVTFKTIDPLFVIDVSDPRAPYVLGELKIPGFSDYLHPYDEDHLIGFGLDTEAMSQEDMDYFGVDGAWYQGVKLAMFDVSDVENPTELHKEIIGDRGTYSELQWNHKALLFDKEKGIIAFPITIAEISDEDKDEDASASTYGDYTYQGAYIYDVSIEDGFEYQGRISHYDDFETEYLDGWDYTKWVSRILYIGDYFYTVSDAMVKANQMLDLTGVGQAVME